MSKDSLYAPVERASIVWVSAPCPGFASIAHAMVSGYFKVLNRPTNNIQPYTLWANQLVELLLRADQADFLESESCRASLGDIGKRGLLARLSCIYCAYMFGQARIVFDECTNSRKLQRSLERLLLNAAKTVRARSSIERVTWDTCRWMRAAEGASGKHPRSIDVLYKTCINKTWEKLSDIFDEETGRRPRKTNL